mmetsp:Transcript_10732/g.13935  ORF Transcript_10732/g.13935 Transcript_10732/m.13935 type:complete len:211 (+) Transcript_10732:120-752(+)
MFSLVDYGSSSEDEEDETKDKPKNSSTKSDESDNSGSSSNESSDKEEEKEDPPKGPSVLPSPDQLFSSVKSAGFMKTADPRDGLPSANDIFASVGQPSFMTGSAVMTAKAAVIKRQKPASPSKETKAKKQKKDKPNVLLPPQMQMKRPNNVTESTELWSLKDKKHGTNQKDKKGKMSFQQREKQKRDRGQASRGKSYVEEEKRILRQMNA